MKFQSSIVLPLLVASIASADETPSSSWTDRAIAPVANPVLFETPLVQSEVRPVFMRHTMDSDFLGTDVDLRLYAVQLRYAVTERLAIIATKDGYIEIDPDGGKEINGWANLSAGVKYAVYIDDAREIVVTPGVTVELPTGDDEVFQGEGGGKIDVFVSAIKGWGDLHLNVHAGARLPFNWDDETANLRYGAMVDYFTCRWFIPFVALNAFTTISEGDRLPLESEGFDLVNLGSSRASGETQASAGIGFRVRPLDQLDFGFAYETGFTPSDDIFVDRFTIDAIWRF